MGLPGVSDNGQEMPTRSLSVLPYEQDLRGMAFVRECQWWGDLLCEVRRPMRKESEGAAERLAAWGHAGITSHREKYLLLTLTLYVPRCTIN